MGDPVALLDSSGLAGKPVLYREGKNALVVFLDGNTQHDMAGLLLARLVAGAGSKERISIDQGDLGSGLLPGTEIVDLDLRPWRVNRHSCPQALGVHFLAVNSSNDITLFQAGLCSRAVRMNRRHLRAGLVIDVADTQECTRWFWIRLRGWLDGRLDGRLRSHSQLFLEPAHFFFKTGDPLIPLCQAFFQGCRSLIDHPGDGFKKLLVLLLNDARDLLGDIFIKLDSRFLLKPSVVYQCGRSHHLCAKEGPD